MSKVALICGTLLVLVVCGSAPVRVSKEVASAPMLQTDQPAVIQEIRHEILEASRGGDGIKRRYWEIELEITAYSLKEPTFSGLPVDEGVLAVDPAVIPLGSIVWVPGAGYCVALDTGRAIKGTRADLYIPDRDEALKWGRRTLTVRVLE